METKSLKVKWRQFFLHNKDVRIYYSVIALLIGMFCFMTYWRPAVKAYNQEDKNFPITITNVYHSEAGYKVSAKRYLIGKNKFGEFTILVTPRIYVEGKEKIDKTIIFCDVSWSDMMSYADNKYTEQNIIDAMGNSRLQSVARHPFIIPLSMVIVPLVLSIVILFFSLTCSPEVEAIQTIEQHGKEFDREILIKASFVSWIGVIGSIGLIVFVIYTLTIL